MITKNFLLSLMYTWEDDWYVEIRCTPVKDVKTYRVLEDFAKKYKVYINEKKSLFLTKLDVYHFNWEEFCFLLREEKICYSVNPRYEDKEGGIKKSGLKNIPCICTLMFDVEAVDKQNTNIDIVYKHVLNFVLYMKDKYDLVYNVINNSGRGFHVLFFIMPISYTDARKDWLRGWYERIINECSSNVVQIDKAVKDVSRVFGLPGAMNPKWTKQIELLEYNDTTNVFTIKSVRKNKASKEKYEGVLPKITESYEWKIITHPNVPTGEIHVTVLFALKLLLKAHNIVDYKQLEYAVNKVRGTNHDLNPHNGTEGKHYHPRIIENWMERHTEWCKSNKVFK